MYGKIIISEVYLPSEEKTIRPIKKGVRNKHTNTNRKKKEEKK